MQGILYEEPSVWLFLLVTVVLGGWAAFMTGKAHARTWAPGWHLAIYLLLLACAVRFLHYALFHGTLLSVQFYAVDAIVLLVVGYLGWRTTRVDQMTTQYRWLYEKTSPVGYRARA